MKRLIGISGKARSGKDSVAKIILEAIPTFWYYDLARPGKEALRAAFGWNKDHTDGPKKDVICPIIGISPREAMQTLLTDWAQNMVRKDIWCVVAEQRLDGIDDVVVPGVRFDHQVHWIHKNNGTMIHVERDAAEEVRPHVSENLARCSNDYVISNNGTQKDLETRVHEILFNLKYLSQIPPPL